MYYLFVSLAWVVFHIPYRVRVIGRENIPTDRGFVLCPNHLSAIDPVFVVIARFWGRPMWIMAKQELFSNAFLRWFFRQVHAFPVERGRGDRQLLDQAIEAVRGGDGMLIFPEGTRSKTGELQRLKSGAFVVAQTAGADIVPCRVIYRGGRQHLFCTVTVIFGKPVSLKELGMEGEYTPAKLRQAKTVLVGRLEELLEENRQYC